MSRIIFSPLAHQIRGSIDQATFSHTKGQSYLKLRKTPRDPKSPAQLAHRAAIGQTPDFWRSLSPRLRAAYAASTLTPHLPGFSIFVSRNWQHLRDSDGIHGPGPTPGQGPLVQPTTNIWFRNMWWADGFGMVSWNDPGQGPDYRFGWFLYDASSDRFAGENLNQAPLAAEFAAVPVPFGLGYYLFGLIIQRLSDGELVHSELDSAWVA